MDRVEHMLNQKKWAVVGATPTLSKFGYKIYKNLKSHGYEVYPVNPNYEEIEGDEVFKSLKDLKVKPDCISVVVSPERSEAVLEAAIEMGIKNIWFQPGTYTQRLVQKSKMASINVIYRNCVLVELGKRKR